MCIEKEIAIFLLQNTFSVISLDLRPIIDIFKAYLLWSIVSHFLSCIFLSIGLAEFLIKVNFNHLEIGMGTKSTRMRHSRMFGHNLWSNHRFRNHFTETSFLFDRRHLRQKMEEKIDLLHRVASFFLVRTYQNGKSIPKDHKLYQTAMNYTKWSLLYQMAVKYTNIFHSKALQNIPVLDFWS
jgi:hypothetical protein